jgi:hypothetical protein
MSTSSKDYEVGYQRPPKHSRWKKGQYGNPDRKYPNRRPSVLEFIDKLLLRPIEVVEKGETKRVTALAIIVLQLWRQEFAGNRQALAVRLKYEAIAQEAAERGVEVELAENDYTRALAAALQQDTDHE